MLSLQVPIFLVQTFLSTCLAQTTAAATDGYWGKWSPWSDCSKSCGEGSVSRSRTCIGPLNGGKVCVGNAQDLMPCETPCVSPGTWTAWENWGQCSKSCNSGISVRARKCPGSTPCVGEESVSKPCNQHPCEVDVAVSPVSCSQSSILSSKFDCQNAMSSRQGCSKGPSKTDSEQSAWWEARLGRLTKLRKVLLSKPDKSLLAVDLILDDKFLYKSLKNFASLEASIPCTAVSRIVRIQRHDAGSLELCRVAIIGSMLSPVLENVQGCRQSSSENAVTTGCEQALTVRESCTAGDGVSRTKRSDTKAWWQVNFKKLTKVEAVRIIRIEAATPLSFQIGTAGNIFACAMEDNVMFTDRVFICEAITTSVRITLERKFSLVFCSVHVFGKPLVGDVVKNVTKCSQSSAENPAGSQTHGCEKALGSSDCSNSGMMQEEPPVSWWMAHFPKLIRVEAVRILRMKPSATLWSFQILGDTDYVCRHIAHLTFEDKVFPCLLVTETVKIQMLEETKQSLKLCKVEIIGQSVSGVKMSPFSSCKQSSNLDGTTKCENAFSPVCSTSSVSKTKDVSALEADNAWWSAKFNSTIILDAVKVSRSSQDEVALKIITDNNFVCFEMRNRVYFSDMLFPCSVATGSLKIVLIGNGSLELCSVQVIGTAMKTNKIEISSCVQSVSAKGSTECKDGGMKCAVIKDKSIGQSLPQWSGKLAKRTELNVIQVTLGGSKKQVSYTVMADETVCASEENVVFETRLVKCQAVTRKLQIFMSYGDEQLALCDVQAFGKIDTAWAPWSPWPRCSNPCDAITRERKCYRLKDKKIIESVGSSSECMGQPNESKKCNSTLCDTLKDCEKDNSCGSKSSGIPWHVWLGVGIAVIIAVASGIFGFCVYKNRSTREIKGTVSSPSVKNSTRKSSKPVKSKAKQKKPLEEDDLTLADESNDDVLSNDGSETASEKALKKQSLTVKPQHYKKKT